MMNERKQGFLLEKGSLLNQNSAFFILVAPLSTLQDHRDGYEPCYFLQSIFTPLSFFMLRIK